MLVCKFAADDQRARVGVIENGLITRAGLPAQSFALTTLLHAADPVASAKSLPALANPLPLDTVKLLAPIEAQEVWAAGVTYKRSEVARKEESAGAAAFYDLVYNAARPELFFKATPHRVVGPGGRVRIRGDAAWNVPEPELALVITPDLRLVGYTLGNDMSSRDIEGENPLYLPQAKIYDSCCGLGPAILLADTVADPLALRLTLTVKRKNEVVFSGSVGLAEMKRKLPDLVDWLGRDNSFPEGVILLTGTGIIPPTDFTLRHEDTVVIETAEIGVLRHHVVQLSE